MSTILKALRRLEEDKRVQTERSLEEAVVEPSARSRGRSLTVWAWAAGGGAAALCLLFWSTSDRWLRDADPEPAAPAPVAVAPAPPPVPVRIEDAPRPPPGEPVPLRAPDTANRIEAFENPRQVRREMQRLAGAPIEPLEDPASEEEETGAAAPPAPKPAARAKPAPKPVAEVKTAPEPPRVAPPERVASAAVATPAREPEPEVTAEPSPAVGLAPVAVVTRERMPDVEVRRISWHPNPDRRAAVFQVEGQSGPVRMGEGDTVAGFTIAEIGISEVELVRDGVTTRRRIGAAN